MLVRGRLCACTWEGSHSQKVREKCGVYTRGCLFDNILCVWRELLPKNDQITKWITKISIMTVLISISIIMQKMKKIFLYNHHRDNDNNRNLYNYTDNQHFFVFFVGSCFFFSFEFFLRRRCEFWVLCFLFVTKLRTQKLRTKNCGLLQVSKPFFFSRFFNFCMFFHPYIRIFVIIRTVLRRSGEIFEALVCGFEFQQNKKTQN